MLKILIRLPYNAKFYLRRIHKYHHFIGILLDMIIKMDNQIPKSKLQIKSQYIVLFAQYMMGRAIFLRLPNTSHC